MSLLKTAMQEGRKFLQHDAVASVADLDEYLTKYGQYLGESATNALRPLHVPGRDKPLDFSWLLRKPFDPQAHAITAAAKVLSRQNSVLHIWECGVGKTMGGMLSAAVASLAIGSINVNAGRRPFRSLIFCPGQLTKKWEREIRETIPDVDAYQLRDWRDVVRLDPREKIVRPTWYVIARDRAKLGAKWRAIKTKDRKGVPCCPKCGELVIDDKTRAPVSFATLSKKKHFCKGPIVGPDGLLIRNADGTPAECGEPLWTYTHELDRWEPARYIQRRLRGFFDYAIFDELHQEKSAESAQANALGAIAAASKKRIGLTGTLIGGYAEHIRPLLFRLSPKSLIEEGLTWSEYMAFNEKYGRIETRITEKESHNLNDNSQSRGSKRQTNKVVRPGIMPSLFGRHLIDKAIFLSLDELADNLPPLIEQVIGVNMDDEVAAAYGTIEEDLRIAIKEMGPADKRLLGKMLQVLLSYPDHPHGFGEIGYYDKESWVSVTECPDLDPERIRPKEKALVELAIAEKAAGRQLWVYCQMTDKRDVMKRLESLLVRQGLRVKILRSNVKLEDREEWIEKNGRSVDVVFSHPQLVETGLDLFDKRPGGHNFCSLAFYQTGYNLFTLRQAARRAWRIGQREVCKVFYFYYNDTMQARAMSLMGKKMTAAAALEGKFSSEGLAAMAGEDSSVELAMAKSLANKLNDLDAARAWEKVTSQPAGRPLEVLPVPKADKVVSVKPCMALPRTKRPARRQAVSSQQLTFMFD